MFSYEVEFDIHRFEFWGGAVRTVETIRQSGMMDELEALIIEMFQHNDNVKKSDINNFLWFKDDEIYDYLGIEF